MFELKFRVSWPCSTGGAAVQALKNLQKPTFEYQSSLERPPNKRDKLLK